MVIVAAFILVLAPVMVVFVLHQDNVQTCHDTQRNYDSQEILIRFIGHELHATDQRINDAIGRFEAERGPRPEC